MRQKWLFVFLVGTLAASSLSCSFSVDLGNKPPTSTPEQATETLAPSLTPILATPTLAENSPTEEVVPTVPPSPTPLPPPQIITAQNAPDLTFKRGTGSGLGSLQKFKVSPNGKTLLLSYSTALKLIDLENLNVIWETDPGRFLWDVVFKEDGSQIVSLSEGGTVQIWESSTGNLISTTTSQQKGVFDLTLSENGKNFAITDYKNFTTIWDCVSGKQIEENNGQSNPGGVNSIDLSPSGELLLMDGIGSKLEKQVQQWRTADGTYKIGLLGLIPEMRNWKFSPDEKRVFGINYRSLTASPSTIINAWNANTGALIKTYPSVGIITRYIISPDGSTILAANQDYELQLLDVETGSKLGTFTGHTARIAGMDFSPDSQKVVSIDVNGKLIEWQAADQNILNEKEGEFVLPYSPVVFSEDGRLAAVLSPDRKKVGTLDTNLGELIQIVGPEENNLSHVAISPGGNLLAANDSQNRIIVWETTSGAKLKMIEAKTRYPIYKIKFSPDENHITSLSSGQIFVWDIETGNKVTEFAGQRDFSYSPSEKVIASDSSDQNLYFTDAISGKKLGLVKSEYIGTIQYSPDGRFIAIGGQKAQLPDQSQRNMIYVIDSQTKEKLPLEMADIPGLVTNIAWNPNQDLLASKDEQGNVQIWDLLDGTLAANFEEISKSPGDLKFNEDGTILFVGGNDGTIGMISTTSGTTTNTQSAPESNTNSLSPELSDQPFTHSSGVVTINLPKDWIVDEKTDLSFIATAPSGNELIAFLATNTNTELSDESFTNYIYGSEQHLELTSKDYLETDRYIDAKNGNGYVTKTVTLADQSFLLQSNYNRKSAVVYQIYFLSLADQFGYFIPVFQGVNASIKINSDFIEKQIPYEELNEIKDPSGKFAYSYPHGWLTTEAGQPSDKGVTFLAPDSSAKQEYGVLPIPSGTQLSDNQVYDKLINLLLENEPSMLVINQEKTKTGGWKVAYEISSKKVSGSMAAIQIDNNLEAVNIVFESDLAEKYQPLVDKIIENLKKQ